MVFKSNIGEPTTGETWNFYLAGSFARRATYPIRTGAGQQIKHLPYISQPATVREIFRRNPSLCISTGQVHKYLPVLKTTTTTTTTEKKEGRNELLPRLRGNSSLGHRRETWKLPVSSSFFLHLSNLPGRKLSRHGEERTNVRENDEEAFFIVQTTRYSCTLSSSRVFESLPATLVIVTGWGFADSLPILRDQRRENTEGLEGLDAGYLSTNINKIKAHVDVRSGIRTQRAVVVFALSSPMAPRSGGLGELKWLPL